MAHPLWGSNNWQQASEEQVIAALFNPPAFIDPADMGQIKQYHPGVQGKYLNLFYSGNIPEYVNKINRIK